MDTKRFITLVLAVVLAPAPAAAADATEPAPDHVEGAAGTELQACSAARVKAWMFIKVARANVYLSDCGNLEHPFSPPVALRFAYEREVPARGFTESANEMLKRNLASKQYARLKQPLMDFNDHYKAVEDGDTYYMLRTKDTLTLWLNERELASVDNPELARHYFRIWFGPEPFSDRLREELLQPLD